ncbi:MAG: polyprenol monophosphomannose synthase [Actinomycetota bacterium]|nr:polyprenol monophosphomannose synthase [Actinomycetota bacterium]
MRALVVVPTYNEALNIAEVLHGIRAAAPEADVLVVDDSSPDGTGALAEGLAAELGQIDVLHRPAKEGLGPAYRAGLGLGIERGYEVIVQMDADLSHDPAALPALLAAMEAGADVAIGSRYVPGGSIPHWPWHRRALSRYGNAYTGFALRTGVADATSGFRAYRVTTLAAIDPGSTRATGYGIQIEIAYRMSRAGATIVEVPIAFTDRTRGTSKMSMKIIAEEMLLVSWWGACDRAGRGSTVASPS